MIKIYIDNTEYRVPDGLSVLAAARLQGIEVPSMCYREGKQHFTSCMICMVKEQESGVLFPSCSVKVKEGLHYITTDEEINESRQTALELLLSEHTGDCEAPCQLSCPAHMDIPRMNRLLSDGEFDKALKVIKEDIPLPSVFGRICPAPCEGACRRKSVDTAVSICLLKRYAGDHELVQHEEYLPEKSKPSGKKVAIIGAGPAGLAAAYYLQVKGHQCDVYDRRKLPGGSLWEEVTGGKLEEAVLRQEIGRIEKLGAWFYPSTEVDPSNFRRLEKEFDAILISSGSLDEEHDPFGIERSDKGVKADRQTYQTGTEKVFAAGSAVRNSRMAIKPLGEGKEAAASIDQYLRGEKVTGTSKVFNSRFGPLLAEELGEYMKEGNAGERIEPAVIKDGYTKEDVRAEASRCLHCDCRALDDCKLRTLSDEYQAKQKRFWSQDRKKVEKYNQHEFVIYEPNKCIKCGICVRIAEEHKEKFGLSFIGRGFDVVIGVPFGEALSAGLEEVARQVVEECPTGALASRELDK